MIIESRNIWRFSSHALHDGRTFAIDWSSFHFEQIAERNQQMLFRQSAKDFFRVLARQVGSVGDQPSPGTLSNAGRLLRRLVQWMISNGIYRFSDLSANDLVSYIERLSRPAHRPCLNWKSVRAHVCLMERMWDLRSEYGGGLKVDPYRIELLYIHQRGARPSTRWTDIPIKVAVPLLKDAMLWLQRDTPLVISVIQDHHSIRGNLVGLSKKEMRKRATLAYAEISARSDELRILRTRLGDFGGDTRALIRKAVHLSLGAAIILILMFTGIRGSELLSLQLACCSRRLASDGGEYYYITGIAAKKAGKEKSWVVPKPVVTAIEFLENLHRCTLLGFENSYLFALPNGVGILPPPYVTVRRMWSSTVARFFKDFASAEFRSSPIKKGVRLHPHQARKTFAKFVVTRDKRGLEALAQHYGHVYTALLDRAYVGSDIDLHHLLDEESQRDLEAGLTDILKSPTLGGRAGEMLADIRREARKTYRGKVALASLVKKLINDGVTLAPCDWGYCVYAKDQSACGGNEVGPNPIGREPQTCATCANFSVTERHRSWWEDRAKREQLFLQKNGLSEQTIEIVRERLKSSEGILLSLNKSIRIRSKKVG